MAIHVGDIGTVFTLTIKDDAGAAVNVSSAAGAGTKKIKFLRPDGTVLEKTATFTTDGTDGKITCTSASGDLNQAGMWKMQGYVALTSWSGHVGEPGETEFEVRPIFG